MVRLRVFPYNVRQECVKICDGLPGFESFISRSPECNEDEVGEYKNSYFVYFQIGRGCGWLRSAACGKDDDEDRGEGEVEVEGEGEVEVEGAVAGEGAVEVEGEVEVEVEGAGEDAGEIKATGVWMFVCDP